MSQGIAQYFNSSGAFCKEGACLEVLEGRNEG